MPNEDETPLEGRGPRSLWGPSVDASTLEDRYAPQEVKPFTVPRGAIDNLGLHSTDMFTIPGQGDFTVDFKGFFRVARDHPTTDDWATSEIHVNIIELELHGRDETLGDVTASLNPDILATGQIFQAQGPGGPKACRIATPAIFDLPQLGVSVFNKEPILLMNEHVVAIPPVNDPSGHALLFRLPLFDREDPDGEPRAYLTSLRYGADHYISESELAALREQGQQ
jgi:hypothetical protein